MAEDIRRVRETTTQDEGMVQTVKEVRSPAAEKAHTQNVIGRVIWYIAGVILVLLAFRFVFALLGANPSNGFADFIFSTTHPLVAPFFGLFNYNFRSGVSGFEIYTLVAMAVYGLIAYGLAKLATITQR